MTRSCEDCTLCCKTHGVRSISKKPHTWCTHCTIGAGCTIYENRPHECRDFTCMWLEGFGDEDERPDKSRCVVSSDFAPQLGEFLSINESRPGSSESLPYVQQLITLAMGKRMPIWIERENSFSTLMLPRDFKIGSELREFIADGSVQAMTYRPLT